MSSTGIRTAIAAALLCSCAFDVPAPMAPPTAPPSAGLPQATGARLMTLNFFPAAPSAVPAGMEQTFVVFGVYSDGSNIDLTAQARWSSSDDAVAIVADTGLVLAARAGTATIQATVDGCTASATLWVAPPILYALELSPTSLSLVSGSSARLHVVGVYTDDSRRDVSAEVSWASSDESVASVRVQQNVAVAHAAGAGSAVISASLNGVSAALAFSSRPAELVAFGLEQTAITLERGAQQQLAAFAVYSDGAVRTVTGEVTWSSSDPRVITFDSTAPGLARGLASGWAEITARFQGRTVSASAEVL